MDDCIFCKIASNQIPAYKVYEDDQFLAFLDIFPLTPGHTLVIPKKHYRWVWDVEPAGEYWQVIKQVAQKLKQQLNTELIASMTIGEEVPHAHYHLLPDSQNLNQMIESFSSLKKQQLTDTEAQQLLQKLKA